jgi:ligand-binding SRPBCC domain-containing protein
MAAHSIRSVQKIPVSLDKAWDFFSHPANLKHLTAAGMRFIVISKHHGDVLYPGQIIEYRFSPFFNIPLYWMTEITHVKEKEYFIDEQRKGPYRLWHHQHHFREIEGGVEMTDIVHYKNPAWFVGNIANTLLIRKKLRNIFEFRYKSIENQLGKWNGQVPDIIIT